MRESYIDRATFSEKIISHLFSCRSSYIQRKILREMVQERESRNMNGFNQSLYRLKSKGLISINGGIIKINKYKLLDRKRSLYFREKLKGNQKIIVLFDIPEKQKHMRHWLRSQLKIWDFTMMQQSVWLGKGELPIEFKNHVKTLGIKDCIKVFKIQK